MFRRIIAAFLLTASPELFAQIEQFAPSIHRRESEYYALHPELVGTIGLREPVLSKRPDLLKTAELTHVVYGFHPYWISDATAQSYYYSLLSHVAYFSAEVDTSGNFSTVRSWETTPVVDYVKAAGKKIHLAVTMFSNHSTVLNNTTKRNTLIANIMTRINQRSADGVNIDFESMDGSLAANWRAFISALGDTLAAYGKELTVELPAVDWSGTLFNSTFFSETQSRVTHYFLMAYDYYWSGSSNAGPVAPLRSSSITTSWHVMRSVVTYLGRGCSASKLIAGFPYYGYDWPVTSSSEGASTDGTGSSRIYSVIRNDYIDTISVSDQFFSSTHNVPWYRYQTTQWRQTWYDDSISLARKYDSVKAYNLAGTGMWALGYDGSYTELWSALKNAFAQTADPTHVSLANFEYSEGLFNNSPTYSGSTTGISTSSTADLTADHAYNGWSSMELVLKDNTSVTTSWLVRFVSGGGTPANNSSLAKNGYIGFWMKTSTAPATSTVSVIVDDGSAHEESSRSNVQNDGDWHLYQWQLGGSGWTSFASGNGLIDSATVTLDAICIRAPNTASDWTLQIDDVSYHSTNPLPVQFASFIAAVENSGVTLRWQTLTETDNYGFEIQRKPGDRHSGDEWIPVGFVKGAGNSSAPNGYEFTDGGIPADATTLTYRIRQINRDASYSFSEAIEIGLNAYPAEFALEQNYPNPFNATTNITFSVDRTGYAELKVYDVLGRHVASPLSGDAAAGRRYTVPFDASALASGVYFYELRSAGKAGTKRMLLMK